ncbi:MAG: hypothetical protein ACRDHM_07345 [Actinomycetota bacterium]
MNDGYRTGLYACWDQATKEFPKDAARRRQRFAELLREQQGLEPPVLISDFPPNTATKYLQEVSQ